MNINFPATASSGFHTQAIPTSMYATNGSKTFTAPGLYSFAIGNDVIIVNEATPTRLMHGNITAKTENGVNTTYTVNVTKVYNANGFTAYTGWRMTLAGADGTNGTNGTRGVGYTPFTVDTGAISSPIQLGLWTAEAIGYVVEPTGFAVNDHVRLTSYDGTATMHGKIVSFDKAVNDFSVMVDALEGDTATSFSVYAVSLSGATGATGATAFAGLTDKTTVDIPATNTPTATAINARELGSNKKTDVDANKTSNTFFPTVKAVFDWATSLFVKGATSSTYNAVARFEGTAGKLVKNSLVTIDDAGMLFIQKLSGQTAVFGDSTYTTKYIQIRDGLNGFEWGLNTSISVGGSAGAGIMKYGSNKGFGIAVNNTTAFADVSAGDLAFAVAPTGNSAFGGAPTGDRLTVNGNFKLTGKFIDNAGSEGTNGQVLKKVGGLVLWSNP